MLTAIAATMKATEDALFAKLGISDRTPSAARRSTSGGTLFDDDEPPMPTPSRPAEYMWPPLPAEKKPLPVSGPPVAADDPLSAAAAAAAPPSANPAAHPSPPNPLLAALTTPMPGFGSSDVAPPSWQLPRLSPLHPGEILLDRPVAATRLSVRLNSPATPRPGTLFLTNKRLLGLLDRGRGRVAFADVAAAGYLPEDNGGVQAQAALDTFHTLVSDGEGEVTIARGAEAVHSAYGAPAPAVAHPQSSRFAIDRPPARALLSPCTRTPSAPEMTYR